MRLTGNLPTLRHKTAMQDEVEANMQNDAEEVMQDGLEGGKAWVLDEEDVVKKWRCNTK